MDFGKDVFGLIFKYLDGRDAARSAQVCKLWHFRINSDQNCKTMMENHYIKITDHSDLSDALGAKGLRDIKKKEGNFEAYMWFNHGINMYLFFKTCIPIYEGLDSFYVFCRALIDIFSEGERCLINSNGTLVFATDFYGSDSPRFDSTRARQVEKLTNGAFTWRFVKFPKLRQDFYKLDKKDNGSFHRGTSLSFILKTHRSVPRLPFDTLKPIMELKIQKPIEKLRFMFGQKRTRWEDFLDTKDHTPTGKLVEIYEDCSFLKKIKWIG